MPDFNIQPIPKVGGQNEIDRWREELRNQLNNATLDSLTDITITEPISSDDVIYWDGSEWVNGPVPIPDLDSTYLRLDTTNDPLTAGLEIDPSADEIQLKVSAYAGQSARMVDLPSSTGNDQAYFDYAGDLFLGMNIAGVNKAHLTIQGSFSQSANKLEFRNYAGSIESFFNSGGGLEVQKTGTNVFVNAGNQSINLAAATGSVVLVNGNGTIGTAGNREFIAGGFTAGAKVGGLSQPVVGGRFSCVPSHPSGGFPDAYGGQFIVSHQDVGTVTRGYVGQFTLEENVFAAGPGFFGDARIINIKADEMDRLTVSNDYAGIYVGAPTFTTGGITGNEYAIYLEQHNSGTASAYQIYSAGGESLLLAGSASITPLRLRGETSQTADIFIVENISESELLSVEADGTVRVNEASANVYIEPSRFHVTHNDNEVATFESTTSICDVFLNASAGAVRLQATAGSFIIKQGTGFPNSEFFRISSSGYVGIGNSTPAAELDVDGGQIGKVEIRTTGRTMNQSLYYETLDGSSSAVTITTPASPNTGQTYHFSCVNSDNTCKIDWNGKALVADTSDFEMFEGEALSVIYDGNRWMPI